LRQNQENHAQQQLDEQEQQQLISQALEEFGRLSAEHHDQDEHHQQQAAQENPEADIDDHEGDHLQRPPQHPPDGGGDGGGGGDPDPGPNQPNPPQLCLPEGGRPYTEPVEPHSLGHMDVECHHCRALHFMTEKLSNSSARNPHFGLCCLQGQVRLPLIQRWPCTLQDLYDNADFRSKIQQYNSALAFTSLEVDVDHQRVQGSGPSSFCIHGALHHLMGTLLPNEGQDASYAQLYIYDPQEATDI